MTRTSSGLARYTAASEYDTVFGTVRTWSGKQPNGIVFCHGSGDSARISYDDPVQFDLCSRLAQNATVILADLGLQTWGNDTAITRIGEAIAYLRTSYGVQGKVALVGASMGNANQMAYARANPSQVRAIAGIIPLTDLTDVMTRGAAAEVNAAYGGTYSDVTNGPTHNPIRYASTLPTTMPIRLWSSPTDALVPYQTALDFQTARPQTVLSTLPNYGHSDASVDAAISTVVPFIQAQF